MMLKLSYWIDELSKWAGALGAIATMALALLIVYDASMRYIFNEGSVALQELEWHLFDILFLLGLSYALKHNKHVRVDLFYVRMSAKFKEIVQIITMIFFVIPLGLLVVWFSWDFVLQSFLQGEMSPDPGGLCCRYIIKSFVIISFILLILQAISETIKAFYRLGELK
ncbi:TRAP transporter small permease subunit [Hydrogenimonas thermophila]|uniref:TRAP transporter small permease subunit n=1 Tax=Hydrogenimonas thermophila TaxID=223786 RepID=UPI0029373A47|nr:TRAP transporter small permease subunit [Hydrogenimonas thermophila]WOE68794.1 TRAP transporter small permease subunit [Hydrogenimonas thermophila]WOE71304.1 TRAP transporter small permease subunit [Hydrogenimonas thermophila]